MREYKCGGNNSTYRSTYLRRGTHQYNVYPDAQKLQSTTQHKTNDKRNSQFYNKTHVVELKIRGKITKFSNRLDDLASTGYNGMEHGKHYRRLIVYTTDVTPTADKWM